MFTGRIEWNGRAFSSHGRGSSDSSRLQPETKNAATGTARKMSSMICALLRTSYSLRQIRPKVTPARITVHKARPQVNEARVERFLGVCPVMRHPFLTGASREPGTVIWPARREWGIGRYRANECSCPLAAKFMRHNRTDIRDFAACPAQIRTDHGCLQPRR